MAGGPSDYTGHFTPDVRDAINRLPRVRPMGGVWLFVSVDAYDTDVNIGSEHRYEQVAKGRVTHLSYRQHLHGHREQ